MFIKAMSPLKKKKFRICAWVAITTVIFSFFYIVAVHEMRFAVAVGSAFILSMLIFAVWAASSASKSWKAQIKAEAELERFFELSPEIFCIADFQGNFKAVNSALERTLGFKKEEFLSQSFLKFIHPEDRARTFEEMSRLRVGKETFDFENRYLCNDGSYRWFSWRAKSLQKEGLIYAVARDVTCQKQLERENLDARKSAQAANQAKSDFLATISHEIRTPLNSIIGMAEVLSETPLSREQEKFLKVFRNAGHTLLNLINDIIDFSKIEAGKLEINPHIFNLKELMSSMIDFYSLKAAQKGLELSLEFNEGLPGEIECDSHRLRQVLGNLIDNAIKYSARGKVCVEVSQSDSKHMILFSVRDEGPGISSELQPRLFKKYDRLKVTNESVGTGLGLYISKALVEMMQGTIGFKNNEAEGSCFYFSIPLREAKAQVRSELSLAPEKLNPLSILLVDDNEDNRLIILSYLKRYPYKITVAKNGLEAVNVFKEKCFDLVLMDIHMPVMDGLDATRYIRHFEKSHPMSRQPTPIVALTAYALKDEAENSIAAGCNSHVTKPIHKETLLRVIEQNSMPVR